MNYAHYLSLFQGIYYLLTGLWPLFSIRTFQRVTGPKIDLWLVKTVGVLVAVIAAVLVLAGFRPAVSLEMLVLGGGSAAALAGIDIYYSSKGTISPIYLVDAVVEITLVAAWAYSASLGAFAWTSA